MERRVAVIIRWLERCVKSYKSGAMESALMDAECARADMENLRGDLWEKLEGRCIRVRRFSFIKMTEVLVCVMGVLLISATPLALQQNAIMEERAGGRFSLEWISPDEMELLSNLRKSPDVVTAFSVEPADNALLEEPVSLALEEPIFTPVVVSPVIATLSKTPVRAIEPARSRNTERSSTSTEQKKPDTTMSYENILALIETGERAMNNNSPAIRVEIASGK